MKISNELIETYLSLVNDKIQFTMKLFQVNWYAKSHFQSLTFTGITIKLNISDPLIYMMIYVLLRMKRK